MTRPVGPILHEGRIAFDVEARLLQEIGERLVASPEVALLELVKNASDADAPSCTLELSSVRGRPCLIISDTGDGMSHEAFKTRWMRIATNSKTERTTPRYKRPVTGQKGIGRFAVRFLGSALRLESTWHNKATRKYERLEAVFDWRRLDRAKKLSDAKVAFRHYELKGNHATGTKLTISRLKQNLAEAVNKNLRTQVLQIVSPISAFDAGRFDHKKTRMVNGDPGFTVDFRGFSDIENAAENIAKDVLRHAWARLSIDLNGDRLAFKVKFLDGSDCESLVLKVDSKISQGLHADIAFAPKRKGAFLGASVNRKQIWNWIRVNSGIAVIDNGFRISPYGFRDDDWLYLNQDGSHNERGWRSTIAAQYFPISEIARARPGLNPALNLAHSNQLVGAVFVSSRASDNPEETDLTPSMDRQGYLTNEAYLQMVEVVRGGLEFMAHADKIRSLRIEEELAAQARAALKTDLADMADAFEADPHLSREEKTALARHYNNLAVRVEKQEDYDRSARQRLEIASGLGIVAGFMTHEAERLFLKLDSVIDSLRSKSIKINGLEPLIKEIIESRNQLDAYIRYTRLYTDSLRNEGVEPFSAFGQIAWIQDVFGNIPTSRGIQTEVECAEDVLVPGIPVAMYSAILLNLYTNATKAIISRETNERQAKILISAWNDGRWHNLTVQDTGVGIPASARERIWDPFFTTTSRVNSPLGTGMGLGLSLVRDLAGRAGGKAELAEPSPGYVTSFHVRFPRNLNG